MKTDTKDILTFVVCCVIVYVVFGPIGVAGMIGVGVFQGLCERSRIRRKVSK